MLIPERRLVRRSSENYAILGNGIMIVIGFDRITPMNTIGDGERKK